MPDKEKQIHGLLIDYLTDSLNKDDILIVKQWINSSAKNNATFEELKHIWQDKSYSSIDKKKSWNRLLQRMKKREPKPVLIKPNFTKIAATIMLLIGMLGYLFIPNSPEYSSITTDKNFLTDTLENGSVLYLYPSSELTQIKNSETYDEYVLKGEAFFVIPEKTDKAISIVMGEAKVQVTGTSFRAKSCEHNTDISITVESGKVELINKNKPKEPMQINAGEQGYFSCNNQQIWKHKNNDNIYLIYQPEI